MADWVGRDGPMTVQKVVPLGRDSAGRAVAWRPYPEPDMRLARALADKDAVIARQALRIAELEPEAARQRRVVVLHAPAWEAPDWAQLALALALVGGARVRAGWAWLRAGEYRGPAVVGVVFGLVLGLLLYRATGLL